MKHLEPTLQSRTRRAFTLLELVVAIIVLGVLAALALPNFASLISSTRQATAKASALAVARDSIALAALSGSSVTTTQIYAAASETSAVSAVSASGITAGVGGIVKFAVNATGSNVVGVCVNMPSAMNGAPTFVALSGSGGC